jgi:hypothetical protein
MFMKGADRADQYLTYYSLLRKTVKWAKKVALWLINYVIFSSFLFIKSKSWIRIEIQRISDASGKSLGYG